MKYDWLLLDLDNTLLNFSASSKLAFKAMLENYRVSPSPEYYSIYQRINNKVWKELEDGKIDQMELRRKRFQLFADAISIKVDPYQMNADYLEQIVKFPVLMPHAVELLESVKGKVNLAIVTNGLKEVQRPRLDQANLTNYFKSIVVSDEIGHSKPQKAFFDYTFETIGFPNRERVLMIGDSLSSDIKGGNNYGLDTCWYNPLEKYGRSDIRPNYVIKSLRELREIV